MRCMAGIKRLWLFAVTGHWIEEVASSEWNEEEALFGFTQMNTAHNGARLGQALYKICNQLSIIDKVIFSLFLRIEYFTDVNHRLDTSHVTMRPIMEPCSKNLPDVISSKQGGNLM